MESRVAKWGNSLGVRIPRSIAKTAEIAENTMVELAVKNGQIIVSKSKTYQLASLLKEIRQSNKHKEIATGSSVGREAW